MLNLVFSLFTAVSGSTDDIHGLYLKSFCRGLDRVLENYRIILRKLEMDVLSDEHLPVTHLVSFLQEVWFFQPSILCKWLLMNALNMKCMTDLENCRKKDEFNFPSLTCHYFKSIYCIFFYLLLYLSWSTTFCFLPWPLFLSRSPVTRYEEQNVCCHIWYEEHNVCYILSSMQSRLTDLPNTV